MIANNSHLEINYKDANFSIEFFAISEALSPEQALEKFVASLLPAIALLKDLTTFSKQPAQQTEKLRLDNLQYKVVSAVTEYYFTIRRYLLTYDQISENTQRNPDIMTHDTKTRLLFQEYLGPFVFELSDPMSALQGFTDILQAYPLSEDKRQEILTKYDKIVEMNWAILMAYKKHLDGHVNLQDDDYQGKNFFDLLDKLKDEDKRHTS